MKKLYSFLFLFVSSVFFFYNTNAVELKALGCKFHNSRKCVDPDFFKKELQIGCASYAGNCRYRFCEANCVALPDDYDVRNLCKKNCFNTALLARFNHQTREALYRNFYSSEGQTGRKALQRARRAYTKESVVQEQKSKQWWRFGRKQKNTELYEKLKAEYERLVEEKVKRMEAAYTKGNKRAATQLEKETVLMIADAVETLVPLESPPTVQIAQQKAEESLNPHEKALAKKVFDQWSRSKKGQQEIARVTEEREKLTKRIIDETGAPQSIAAAVKRQSGRWEGGVFIPAPPTLPKSEKVLRFSRLLAEERRRLSQASLDDLPPPPALSSESTGEHMSPLPPPPTSLEQRTRFESANVIPTAEESALPPAGAIPPPPPPPGFNLAAKKSPQKPVGDRANFLAEIAKGKKLRKGKSSAQQKTNAGDPLSRALAQRRLGIGDTPDSPEDSRGQSPLPTPRQKIKTPRSSLALSRVASHSGEKFIPAAHGVTGAVPPPPPPPPPGFNLAAKNSPIGSTKQKSAPKPTGPTGGNLLAEIQQGKKLKPVQPLSRPKSNSPQQRGALGALMGKLPAAQSGVTPNSPDWDDSPAGE